MDGILKNSNLSGFSKLTIRNIVLLNFFIVIEVFSFSKLFAQGSNIPFEGELIRKIDVKILNPGSDTALLKTMESKVRSNFYLYPSERFSRLVVNAYLGKVRRIPEVANADYEIFISESGGLNLTILIELKENVNLKYRNYGFLSSGRMRDFPVLIQTPNSILEVSVKTGQMFYSNINPWYSQPDTFLYGNPLADGNIKGSGFSGWYEGYLSAGLYTMFRVIKPVYFFGGGSFISSWKLGADLFTAPNNTFTALEDAFTGIFSGFKTKKGNILKFLVRAGRFQISIADGMLIRNTSSNGSYKSALQLNPRWATDLTYQISFGYNRSRIQLLEINPDEFYQTDTHTKIRLANAEIGENSRNQIGLTYAAVPASDFKYYTQKEIYYRAGLRVADLRYYHLPLPGTGGFIFKTEIARQFHSEFEMNAWGGYGEIGWSFMNEKYSPYVTFRHSVFTGDNLQTPEFERWDPLLSGGNGEEWVQGSNDYKVVQNSNIIAERIQLKLKPIPVMEVVSQFWLFRAYDRNNLGGSAALSALSGKYYGMEINAALKYYPNKNWYFHGQIAFTKPGDAVVDTLNESLPSWLSIMGFFTYTL